MVKNKKNLTGLEHSNYEHPFDRKALNTLEHTPGLKLVGDFINRHVYERIYTIEYTGSNLKMTKESYPKVYEYLEYACKILDIKQIPDLYSQWSYNINAFTVGSEHPIIVLNSGVLDLCDDDEIMFIIGHECGHIKSNHMLYHMMAQIINGIIDQIPFGNIAAAPLQFALYYWDRMSEFTADRAGLLCCQNKDAAIRSFMKMSGMPQSQFCNMNTDAFIRQAADFKELDYEALNRAVKFISIMDESHPWSVMRAAELLKWMKEGEYDKIICHGNIPIKITSKANRAKQMIINKKE